MNKVAKIEKTGAREHRRDFVKRRLKELKKTQVDLAHALEIEPSRLSERLRHDKTDTFTPGELHKIAEFLDIPFFHAVGKLTSLDDFDDHKFIYLQILGEAQAGKWKKTMLKQAGVSDYLIMEREDTDYPNMFGLRVTDDCMDKYYPPYKTVAVCVPYSDVADKKSEFKSGRHVVVCKRGPEDQYEITIKELSISGGEIFLMPKSANDTHCSYELRGKDGADSYYGTPDLKIIGLVVRAVVDQPVPQAAAGAESLP